MMPVSPSKILEKRLKSCLLLVLLTYGGTMFAQKPGSPLLLDFNYGFQAPLADMKDRFGGNNAVGIGIESIRLKSKFFFGIDGNFFFGSNVKEDVLTHLRTFDGSLIGIDGSTGDVNLKERGWYAGLHAGRIFSTSAKKSSLTGIRTQIGIGLLQHKIRVQDNFNNIVALEKKYLPGYDRLTNGPAFHLALGYQYNNPANNFHFKIMSDLFAASTKSRRDLDFATGTTLDKNRTDVLLGLHVAYVVMLSRTRTEEFIYY